MSDSKKSIIGELIALSAVDAALARLLAERKGFERQLIELRAEFEKRKKEYELKVSEVKDVRHIATREDKYLKGERDKLVARRKALSTLGDYKTQQAAEREIDSTEAQLNRKEEEVLQVMIKADELEAQQKKIAVQLENVQQDLEKQQLESEPFFANITQREQEKRIEREGITSRLDASVIQKYNTTLKRYPVDPVSAIKGNTCVGCFMSVGPQVIVKVSRGESLEQCPGCHRILYIPDSN